MTPPDKLPELTPQPQREPSAPKRKRDRLGSPPSADNPGPGQGRGGKRGPRVNLHGTPIETPTARQQMGEAFGPPAAPPKPDQGDSDNDLEGRQHARGKFRELMTDRDREEVFHAVLKQAKGGMVAAAALLMQYDMGKPTAVEEKIDRTPVKGKDVQEAIERMRREAAASGVDVSLLQRGIWGANAGG